MAWHIYGFYALGAGFGADLPEFAPCTVGLWSIVGEFMEFAPFTVGFLGLLLGNSRNLLLLWSVSCCLVHCWVYWMTSMHLRTVIRLKEVWNHGYLLDMVLMAAIL